MQQVSMHCSLSMPAVSQLSNVASVHAMYSPSMPTVSELSNAVSVYAL